MAVADLHQLLVVVAYGVVLKVEDVPAPVYLLRLMDFLELTAAEVLVALQDMVAALPTLAVGAMAVHPMIIVPYKLPPVLPTREVVAEVVAADWETLHPVQELVEAVAM